MDKLQTTAAQLKKQHTGQITVQQLADVIEALLRPNTYDMETIEKAANQIMKNNGLKFRDYFDLLHELMLDQYGYELTPFNFVSEYFYDKINTAKLSRARLEHFVEQTIIF